MVCPRYRDCILDGNDDLVVIQHPGDVCLRGNPCFILVAVAEEHENGQAGDHRYIDLFASADEGADLVPDLSNQRGARRKRVSSVDADR